MPERISVDKSNESLLEHEDSRRPSVDIGSYSHPRPLGYLFRRGLWACFQLPFARGMPKRLSVLRIWLLRMFGAQIAENCVVCGGVKIWEPWSLEMGRNAVLGEDAVIYNLAKITIGSNVVVSQGANLCTASHDYTDPAFPLFSRPIRIADSAWVASNAYVGPGISIGEGAVIGACAVVTKDMPPWMICAGNPCRPIKPRSLRMRE